MAFGVVDRDADDLDAPCLPLGVQLRNGPELRGADGREILRVAEQDGPTVADPVMEPDRPLAGVGLEIGNDLIDTQAHVGSPR